LHPDHPGSAALFELIVVKAVQPAGGPKQLAMLSCCQWVNPSIALAQSSTICKHMTDNPPKPSIQQLGAAARWKDSTPESRKLSLKKAHKARKKAAKARRLQSSVEG
jgi:hypothetical protein